MITREEEGCPIDPKWAVAWYMMKDHPAMKGLVRECYQSMAVMEVSDDWFGVRVKEENIPLCSNKTIQRLDRITMEAAGRRVVVL